MIDLKGLRTVKDKDKNSFLAGRLAHTGEKVHCPWPGREVKADRGSFLNRLETEPRNLEKLSLETWRTPRPCQRQGLLTCFLVTARNGGKG